MLGLCNFPQTFDWALCSLLAGVLLVAPSAGRCQPADRNGNSASTPDERINGTWRLVTAESSPIDPWNTLTVAIDAGPARLSLTRRWHGPTDYTTTDSVRIPIDGDAHRAPLPEWPDNRHIGAFADPDRPRRVQAEWLDDGRTLRVTSRFGVETSQGTQRVRTYTEYRVAPDGDRLVVIELRSTRPKPRRYVLERTSGPPSG
jgi:hypothetical protein